MASDDCDIPMHTTHECRLPPLIPTPRAQEEDAAELRAQRFVFVPLVFQAPDPKLHECGCCGDSFPSARMACTRATLAHRKSALLTFHPQGALCGACHKKLSETRVFERRCADCDTEVTYSQVAIAEHDGIVFLHPDITCRPPATDAMYCFPCMYKRVFMQ